MTRNIVNRLRTNRDCLAPCLMDEAADEIVRLERVMLDLIAERDEARREVCLLSAELPTERLVAWNAARMPKQLANQRGWDCFKEDGK
jgi:hypothetical protein